MKKEKIALVTIRYGTDINGGAEYHCRLLAERLVYYYDVEVLTTCVRNYNTGQNELLEGIERVNNVLVRRFKVDPVDGEKHRQFSKEEKLARKLRRLLFRFGVLKYISNVFPIWSYKRDAELKAFQSYPFYSPEMNRYIQENQRDYKAFIPINMAESTTFFTAMIVPQKTILIPTMHNQSVFFKSLQTEVMTRVAYVGFNTEAEQKLAELVFGKHLASHGIISVGVELAKPTLWEDIKVRYGLEKDYLLYIGRIDPGKMGDLFDYFLAYKQRYSESSLQLVLVGGMNFAEIPFRHQDVIYTGFVSEEDKISILLHAKVVVNPSKFESLSLMLLEAMHLKKVMLVNGNCSVLKEHCINSHFAALYYLRKNDFVEKLRRLEVDYALRQEMEDRAEKYVKANYNWDIILQRLHCCIQNIK